jgi:hypothetical protein
LIYGLVRRLDRGDPRPLAVGAQFEHSVGVTETGVEIFTLTPNGLDKPPPYPA